MSGGNDRSGRPSRGTGGRGGGGGRGAGGKGGAKRVTGGPKPPRRNRSRPANQPAPDVHVDGGIRLQKLLAGAGVASRRASEELIAAGRVSVDGVVVTELGVRVDPSAVIHVDGLRIQQDVTKVYLALNKPLGVVCTMKDTQGRPCLGDIVGSRNERLFHVGRLDTDTEGLLLLTNDGELANRLTHPAYEVPKVYVAEVRGPVPRGVGKQLREGIVLDDGLAQVDSFKLIDSRPGHALVEVVLHEGRNRIVRRLLEAVGHPVERLARTQVGPILLGDLLPGRTRALTRGEVGELMRLVGM